MIKQSVLNIMNEMPENFPIDELMYKLYILANHEKAMRDIEDGNVYSSAEVKQMLSQRSVVS